MADGRVGAALRVGGADVEEGELEALRVGELVAPPRAVVDVGPQRPRVVEVDVAVLWRSWRLSTHGGETPRKSQPRRRSAGS